MGEPNISNSQQVMLDLLIAAFSPGGKVRTGDLRRSGLHREVLKACYGTFKPEIKNLVGWKPLREYGYLSILTSEVRTIRRAEELTDRWHRELDKQNLSSRMAILIYDGEELPMPARDYRVFLLRDGRLLYYVGGFNGEGRRFYASSPTCGGVLTVLDAMDKEHPWEDGDQAPFVVLMRAFVEALRRSINERKARIAEQEAIRSQIEELIGRVSNK